MQNSLRRIPFVALVALVAFVTIASFAAQPAGAQMRARDIVPAPSPTPSSAPTSAGTPLDGADCRLVGSADAARVLGYPVEAPDETSARGGICFFTTRAISQEGSVTYALVTVARLRERRAFFAASARLCAGVATSSPRAGICKTYARLAEARDLDAYFEARTDYGDAEPVPKLGDRAVAAADALYVRRGAIVFEFAVRRGPTLDVARSIQLARLVLERVPLP